MVAGPEVLISVCLKCDAIHWEVEVTCEQVADECLSLLFAVLVHSIGSSHGLVVPAYDKVWFLAYNLVIAVSMEMFKGTLVNL